MSIRVVERRICGPFLIDKSNYSNCCDNRIVGAASTLWDVGQLPIRYDHSTEVVGGSSGIWHPTDFDYISVEAVVRLNNYYKKKILIWEERNAGIHMNKNNFIS